MVEAALQTVALAVRRALSDLGGGDLVLVACSGGPDSLALAAATAYAARRAEWRAGAVIVDHGLQPGSARVAATAAQQCRELGLDPVEVREARWQDLPVHAGPEADARTVRYRALSDAAQRGGASAVLLAHSADDQAETVLLRLARGSGAGSLRAMSAREGLWRRPVLALRREVLGAAVSECGLVPWHDPTNAGGPGDPLRSRLRATVMPVLEEVLGPGVVPGLVRSAAAAQEDDDALDVWADAVRGQARRGEGAAAAYLIEPLEQVPAAVRQRVIHRALHEWGCPPGAVTRSHVAAVAALVSDWHGQGPIAAPGGIWVARQCGRLVTVSGETRQRAPVARGERSGDVAGEEDDGDPGAG